MTVGRSCCAFQNHRAWWQHVGCSRCSSLWHVSLLACSHRWHSVCSFLWKGLTNCLRLIAVFLFCHQLQKQVDPPAPCTLRLLAYLPLARKATRQHPREPRGSLEDTAAWAAPHRSHLTRCSTRATPAVEDWAPLRQCQVEVIQETVSVRPSCPVSRGLLSPRLWHQKTKNSKAALNRFFL